MPAAKELASAAQEAITYELKVEGDDAQLIASYPLREDATETVSSYTASVVGDAQFDNGLIFTDTTEQNLGNYADLTDRTLLDQIKASRSVTFSAWVGNDTTDNNSNAKTTVFSIGALTFLYLGDAPTSSADIYRDMTGGIRDFRIYLPCQKTEEINAQVLSELKDKATETLRRALNASEDNKVTTTVDLTLPTVCIPTMQIAWGSSDETVMRADGTLQQIVAQDTQLTLNATVTTSLSDTYAQVIPFTVTIAPESETVMRQWLQETLDGLEIKNAEDARGNLTLPTEGYNRFVSVTWKSGDQAVISDETVGGIAPGVVTRGVEDRQVTMTATAAVAGTELSAEHVFTVNVPKAATLAPFEKYLFAFFTGEGHSTGEQVYFAQSKDGFNWKALNGAQPVLTSTKGDRGVRDPFILRSHEGDKFYLIATDLRIDNGAGWGAAQTAYLTGKGNYKNVLKTRIAVPFRIIAKDIADADIDVSYIDTYAEPGKANGTVKPSVSVKYGRKTLGKKDYILTWKDADGEAVEKIRTADTYTGVIHGIGTYGGMKSVNFVILPKWLKF